MVGGQVSLVAGLVGYLIGSMPSANGLSKLWGIDLRASGSGNPGANNALRLGGYTLAIAVFLAEMSKGVLAVAVGLALGGELGAVVAGAGAIAGNVYNVWYSFRGGKGLAIAAGVLLAAWPVAFPFLIILAALGAATTRSSGLGTLIALGGAMVGGGTLGRFFLAQRLGCQPQHAHDPCPDVDRSRHPEASPRCPLAA